MKREADKSREDKENRKVSTLYLVMAALFTAVTFVGTILIRIPVGIGYVNFGDAVVMIAAVVLGPVGAALAGGLGSALADLVGFAMYAPFTLVIKGLEGFVCGVVFKSLLKGKNPYLRALVSFLLGAATVVVGYALTDMLLVLFGAAASDGNIALTAVLAGVATLVPSLIQVGVSAAVALVVSPKLPTLTLLNEKKNR